MKGNHSIFSVFYLIDYDGWDVKNITLLTDHIPTLYNHTENIFTYSKNLK